MAKLRDRFITPSIAAMVQEKYDAYGHWGISYTVDTYDGDGNPTQITFADGIVLTLTYTDGDLTQAVYKKSGATLKTCTFAYNSDKQLTSYTVA